MRWTTVRNWTVDRQCTEFEAPVLRRRTLAPGTSDAGRRSCRFREYAWYRPVESMFELASEQVVDLHRGHLKPRLRGGDRVQSRIERRVGDDHPVAALDWLCLVVEWLEHVIEPQPTAGSLSAQAGWPTLVAHAFRSFCTVICTTSPIAHCLILISKQVGMQSKDHWIRTVSSERQRRRAATGQGKEMGTRHPRGDARMPSCSS